MDQSKKTMRHFYCRDVLWETFEQMANDFDCSIDYLINESMRYYARSKNYPASGQGAGASSAGMPQQPATATQPPPPMGARRPASTTSPPPPSSPPTTQQPRRPAPPTPAGHLGGGVPMGGGLSPAGGRPAPSPSYAPPSSGSGGGVPAASMPPQPGVGGAPTLFLMFNGQRYPVTKDQFIIGRGSKTSDLAIKDGNISRKHAAVIRRNGTFYIKDLGSTNGIDYKGMRIDNKRIDEGDIFHLCDYELRFTYRGD